MRESIKFLGVTVWERTMDEPVTLQDPAPSTPPVQAQPAPQASFGESSGYYNNVFAMTFDGEKNPGDLGPIRLYHVDNKALLWRSWQLFLESELCQTLFRRYGRWVIGSGLRLQAEPQKNVLASEKIEIDTEAFNKEVEARFKIYAKSKIGDYAGMKSVHKKAAEAFKNAIIGGDVLVVLRVESGSVNVQLIDGEHVGSPVGLRVNGTDFVTDSGNLVRHGVELDDRGQHVAYYVRNCLDPLKYDRIVARGEKSGQLMAYMVYGLEYRLDSVRGIPLITAIMETAKKLERYKEATVGSAEERQKIPLAIEHGATSTGENPFAKQLGERNGFVTGSGTGATSVDGRSLEMKVAATWNKQAINLPNDSKLVQLTSTNELNFDGFYTPNVNLVCATIGIPPNVAMMLYNDSFSASRAALKDWEHTLGVEREWFSSQYYQPIYQLWLYVQVSTNKISAPGFLAAVAKRSRMAIEAYTNARWEGANVPHIDPEKEARAERLKLGPSFDNVPLTTLEAATEALNGGDSESNMEQASKELEKGRSLGFKPEEITPDPGDGNSVPNED